MQKILGLATVAAALVSTNAAIAKSGYQPRGFLRSGYSEKLLAPGVWEVRGSSHDAGASVDVALYRAAELASGEGVTEIRITRQKIKSTTVSERNTYRQISYNEVTEVTARAVRSAQDRTACDMPDPAKCMTLPVAGIMSTYGPRMAVAAALPGAAPAPTLNIVTTSPYSHAIADFLTRNPRMRAVPAPVAAPPRPYAPPSPRGSASAIPVSAVVRSSPGPASPTAADTLAARLKAMQPVRGGDPKQGWTISD